MPPPVPSFPSCETLVAQDGTYRAHNFQFQMYAVNLKRPGVTSDPPAALMYCTQCGLTYILDPDQQTWRQVTMGEPWQTPQ